MKEDQFQQLQIGDFSQWDSCQSENTHPERSSLFYISPSFAHCNGSNSFEIFWGLWYQVPIFRICETTRLAPVLTVVIPFSQSDSIMSIILYSFWGILLYSHVLVFFSEFLYTDVVFFSRKLIQRVSIFLVSLWFSSLAFVSCNLLWFENKELRPSCNKVVYQNRFAVGSRIQVNACLY